MSRLLFAAARGARVQANYQGLWGGVHGVHLGMSPHDYRIHPEDAHFAYGPISTALREIATGDYEPSEYVFAASGIANYLNHRWQYRWDDTLHRSLFLLILAEALADEGL